MTQRRGRATQHEIASKADLTGARQGDRRDGAEIGLCAGMADHHDTGHLTIVERIGGVCVIADPVNWRRGASLCHAYRTMRLII